VGNVTNLLIVEGYVCLSTNDKWRNNLFF